MEVIRRGKLTEFIRKHAQAKGPVAAWLANAESSEWRSHSDIQDVHSRASRTSKGNTVFRLGGNKYRLVTKMWFDKQAVSVVWIGTHAEYDRRRF